MSHRHAISAHDLNSQPLRRGARCGDSSSRWSRDGEQKHPSAKPRPDKQQWAKIWFGKLAKFYLHVLNRLEVTVTSPLDRLGPLEARAEVEKPGACQSSQHQSVRLWDGGIDEEEESIVAKPPEEASPAPATPPSSHRADAAHLPLSVVRSDSSQAETVETPRQSRARTWSERLIPLASSLRRLVSLPAAMDRRRRAG